MDKKLSKILMIVVFVMAVIGGLLYVVSSGVEVPPVDADGYAEAVAEQGSKIGNFVSFALMLLAITAVLAVAFSLVNLFKKPALLKKSLIALVILGIILAGAYFTADAGEVLDAKGMAFPNSAGSISKWVGTAINYSIFLLIIGGIAFVADMIKNIIK